MSSPLSLPTGLNGGLALVEAKAKYLGDVTQKAAQNTWDNWFKNGAALGKLRETLKEVTEPKKVALKLAAAFVEETLREMGKILAEDGLEDYEIPADLISKVFGLVGKIPLTPKGIAETFAELAIETGIEAKYLFEWLNGTTSDGKPNLTIALFPEDPSVVRDRQLDAILNEDGAKALEDAIGLSGAADAIPDDFFDTTTNTIGLPVGLTPGKNGAPNTLDTATKDGQNSTKSSEQQGGSDQPATSTVGDGRPSGSKDVETTGPAGATGTTRTSEQTGQPTTSVGTASGGATGGGGVSGDGQTPVSAEPQQTAGTAGAGSSWERTQYAGRNSEGENILVTTFTRTNEDGTTTTVTVEQTFEEFERDGPPAAPEEETPANGESSGEPEEQTPADDVDEDRDEEDDQTRSGTQEPGDEDSEDEDAEDNDSNDDSEDNDSDDNGSDDDSGDDGSESEEAEDNTDDDSGGSEDASDDGGTDDADSGDSEDEDPDGYTPLYDEDSIPIDFTKADAFEFADTVTGGLTNPAGPGGSRDAVLSGAVESFGDATNKLIEEIFIRKAPGSDEEDGEIEADAALKLFEEKKEEVAGGPDIGSVESTLDRNGLVLTDDFIV